MNTPAKFTPGPWIVQADPQWTGKHPNHESRFITTDDALVYEPAFSDLSRDYMGFTHDAKQSAAIICSMRDSGQQAANANLIAAAPALYAALEALVAATQASNARQSSLGDCIISELHQAIDALALARGEKGETK